MSENLLTEMVNDIGEAEHGHRHHKAALGSLEDRVARRRQELEKRTTDLFDVPGFEDLFKVELQVVGGKRQYAIYQRHERLADEYQQNLRVAADCILVATVGFHAVTGDEGHTQPAEGASWKNFALAFDKTLDRVELEKPGGGRIALIRLLGEEGVIRLAAEWKRWLTTRGVKVERELGEF